MKWNDWPMEALRRVVADLRRDNTVLRAILETKWKQIRALKKALEQAGGTLPKEDTP